MTEPGINIHAVIFFVVAGCKSIGGVCGQYKGKRSDFVGRMKLTGILATGFAIYTIDDTFCHVEL